MHIPWNRLVFWDSWFSCLGRHFHTYLHKMKGTFIINGIVKDKKSNKTVEYVNVSIKGTNTGTITNTDGSIPAKSQGSSSLASVGDFIVGLCYGSIYHLKKRILTENILSRTQLGCPKRGGNHWCWCSCRCWTVNKRFRPIISTNLR